MDLSGCNVKGVTKYMYVITIISLIVEEAGIKDEGRKILTERNRKKDIH